MLSLFVSAHCSAEPQVRATFESLELPPKPPPRLSSRLSAPAEPEFPPPWTPPDPAFCNAPLPAAGAGAETHFGWSAVPYSSGRHARQLVVVDEHV